MDSGTLLLALLLLPLAGSAVVAALGANQRLAKLVAVGFALASLALTVVVWFAYLGARSESRFALELSVPWIPAFGTSFALGIDGIALVMLALIAVLVPIVMLFSWEERLPEGRSASGLYALLLSTQSLLVGVFAATDVFLFYVFFEAMLVPMYFMIGRFGGPRRQYAAVKFFLYSLLGGLIMLASVIGLFVVSGEELGQGTFTWVELQRMAAGVDEGTQILLFLGFFVAFAIKAPLVPFHTWLPDAGAEAPVGAGVLLVGVLDKVGTFGFLRYCLPLFPLASQRLAPLVLTLAVIGVLYGALLAVGQTDMKRFVAYTSIAHFGFIALGIFSFSSQAFAGATLYMVNHGISTGMLFIVVGLLIARGGSRLIGDYGGVHKLAPLLAGSFLIAGLSSLALPGTNSFVSEFLVLVGSYPRQPVFTILATVGIIFAALYVLWVYQQVMQGPVRGAAVLSAVSTSGPGTMLDPTVEASRAGGSSGFPDLGRREIAVLTPLIVLILVLGFFPGPVLDVITPSVIDTMNEVGLPDPVGGLAQ
ncbi:NADH-quinone oxidoreductase subunit M [Pseudonocardia sp. KRD-184]|uniref:NADH-quinone oxidoreductase subunit M n=1 Tax=Pseudonocardia oceani TaxID=2792013 RepID=A0ABS6U781_9PSEU|nr:NADH-quinone oxidoreductase subunit M [Pseudonocardia oceani]MBW0089841.1 NADH-quinone oxidoreductase subunit M [Pseudonocardia oceani]MBW0096955.1 NADH-quinone oxidoreductase subunit M [Pseudonocardia oceani]MBW0108944.1 NADH-quinone oxidoreductase subunit M [Pseudonocardia oceani]MBW0120876.1 NADH-quinone oxidoreductase subunit M [Pseudonocardia oceani]MBW0128087.1 NADH-quinone oxidoreductase subunit M [Pseudonocardia oceani]